MPVYLEQFGLPARLLHLQTSDGGRDRLDSRSGKELAQWPGDHQKQSLCRCRDDVPFLFFSESLRFRELPKLTFFPQLNYVDLTEEKVILGALEGEGQTGCC